MNMPRRRLLSRAVPSSWVAKAVAEKARQHCCLVRLRFSTAIPGGLLTPTPPALLPHNPIKAAARYTTKYLILHLGAYPATPNASAHIVAPYTALGLRIRDTPIVARLVVIGAFGQTRCKAKSLAF